MLAYANMSAPHLRQALLCEVEAAQYLVGEGYSLLYHRQKICHVEVDLIVCKDGVVTLVEVKTLASFDRLSHRLPPSQKQRLLRARSWFENYYRLPTELSLVVVPSDFGGIQSFLVT